MNKGDAVLAVGPIDASGRVGELADGAAKQPDGAPPLAGFVRCENPGDPLPSLVEDRSVYEQDSTS